MEVNAKSNKCFAAFSKSEAITLEDLCSSSHVSWLLSVTVLALKLSHFVTVV